MFYADSQAFLAPQGMAPILPEGQNLMMPLILVTSAAPFITNVDEALKAHEMFRDAVLSNPGARLLMRPGDITVASKGFTVVLGMQHAPTLMTRQDVRRFREAGLRFMALAYEDPTEYGDGFKGTHGLTNRGRNLIKWMAEFGIQLDLSHLGHQSAREALTFIEEEKLEVLRPMASHSGCYGIFKHPRNLPIDILATIARLDGYVGIPLLSPLIAHEGENSFDAFVHHVRHAVNVCGAGTIGIGSDLQHIDMSVEEARKTYEWLLSKVKPVGVYFPDRPIELIEHGSQMFPIIEAKVHSNFSSGELEGLLGQSFRNYLLRVMEAESIH